MFILIFLIIINTENQPILNSSYINNEYYNHWFRISGFEYYRGINLNRISIAEASLGEINSGLGFGIGLFEILSSGQDTSPFYLSAYNMLPLTFYYAIPLGTPPYFSEKSDSGSGKITFIPRVGVYQYPASLYFLFRASLIGFTKYDEDNTYSITFTSAVGFEKALWFQTAIGLEGGISMKICPFKDYYKHVLFAGLKLNLLSSWRRIDL